MESLALAVTALLAGGLLSAAAGLACTFTRRRGPLTAALVLTVPPILLGLQLATVRSPGTVGFAVALWSVSAITITRAVRRLHG